MLIWQFHFFYFSLQKIFLPQPFGATFLKAGTVITDQPPIAVGRQIPKKSCDLKFLELFSRHMSDVVVESQSRVSLILPRSTPFTCCHMSGGEVAPPPLLLGRGTGVRPGRGTGVRSGRGTGGRRGPTSSYTTSSSSSFSPLCWPSLNLWMSALVGLSGSGLKATTGEESLC